MIFCLIHDTGKFHCILAEWLVRYSYLIFNALKQSLFGRTILG